MKALINNFEHRQSWASDRHPHGLKETLINLKPIHAKTSKSGREYFRLGAESYSSLGRVGKKSEENSVYTFGRSRLWTSFESSPVSVNI